MKKILDQLSIINFLVITIAGIINAIGVTMFLAPVNLYDSGISGTSMLFAQMTPDFMTLSIFLILLNFPLFVFGMKKQGSVFTIYSLYAVAVYSIVSFLIINILPVNVSIASPLAEQDLFLCALFGGMISGVGSGLTIRFGGAIDGIEVMAVIFAKRLGITVGTFCMCYNVVLYVIIGIIKSNWILPLYSIVTYMAALKTIDFIVEGLDRDKTAIIVTSKEQEICNALSEEFGTGITLINAKGYYSNEEKTMVYLVVNRFQIGKMNAIIHALDENAFITITENI
ncbi:MAG: YitT family protein [Emergencia timonensis]|uniref:YitT family protein n=1 Tax=Emergencia timonensis TaxID=1776384 RepID=UPI000AB48506|nr:YitT family protein [Emergencia timonensis]WNX90278.1 YitT family protein [Emergencia timonensis]